MFFFFFPPLAHHLGVDFDHGRMLTAGTIWILTHGQMPTPHQGFFMSGWNQLARKGGRDVLCDLLPLCALALLLFAGSPS